mmetsp:Transcript_9758/g.29664  ORF Transcript_9758/g.29664 Transcript_9758/m.29664 type:complete len:266 (+) Transcript_9758:2924-3721(+)
MLLHGRRPCIVCTLDVSQHARVESIRRKSLQSLRDVAACDFNGNFRVVQVLDVHVLRHRLSCSVHGTFLAGDNTFLRGVALVLPFSLRGKTHEDTTCSFRVEIRLIDVVRPKRIPCTLRTHLSVYWSCPLSRYVDSATDRVPSAIVRARPVVFVSAAGITCPLPRIFRTCSSSAGMSCGLFPARKHVWLCCNLCHVPVRLNGLTKYVCWVPELLQMVVGRTPFETRGHSRVGRATRLDGGPVHTNFAAWQVQVTVRTLSGLVGVH